VAFDKDAPHSRCPTIPFVVEAWVRDRICTEHHFKLCRIAPAKNVHNKMRLERQKGGMVKVVNFYQKRRDRREYIYIL